MIENLTKRIKRLEQMEQEYGTVATAAASGSLTLTAANQDVAGATLSLDPGVYQVVGTFYFQTGNDDLDNGQTARGVLDVDGIDQTAEAVFGLFRADGSANERAQGTVVQSWFITLLVAGVAKLQARKSGGTGTSTCQITNTTITATKVAVVG